MAPLDLRLVPAALCVWGGSLLVLWGGPAPGGTVAGAAAVGAVVVAAVPGLRARRWWSGLLAALICLAAAAGMVALRTAQVHGDPLFQAGLDGSRAMVVIQVDVDPVALAAQPGRPGERFLVRGTLREIVITKGTLAGSVPATVFADGAEWGAILPGAQISTSGRLGVDAFTGWPTVSIQADAPPTMVAAPAWWQRVGGAFRNDFTAVASTAGGEAAGLLPGIVLGDRTGISPALTQDAKITGLTHLLAVSGSHFVILCGAVLLVLRRAGPRIAAVGGAVFALALVVVVRPSPSVLRAAVMGGLTLSALLVGRTRSTVPALAAAVIVLLLADPELAEDPGFALSVQATAAIVLVAPRWVAALERRGWPTGWASLLAVPAVAQLGTMPVIAGLSGTVSVWALPANILAAFAVPMTLILGAITALLAGWWVDGAGVVLHAAAPAAEWIAFSAHWVAGWPLALVPWPDDPAGVIALGVLVVGIPLTLRARRLRAVAVTLVLGTAAVLVPVTAISGGWPPTGWTAVGCDVGQGDGFVVATGIPGEAVVFDTGPEPSVMDRCLERLGIDHVPLLVLTHLHADHVDGVAGVLGGRTVDTVAVGPGREPAAAWTTVLQQAAAAGVPVTELALGARLTVGTLTLFVLGPDPSRVSRFLGPNDQSLVVMIETGSVRMLFTGDIEDVGQQSLLASGADLRADVLKIPHHGSAKLRPDFMDAVGARIVLIGVGAGNDFGHPTAVALRLAAQAGARMVLRTDTGGDIAVSATDGVLAGFSRGASMIRSRSTRPAGTPRRRGRRPWRSTRRHLCEQVSRSTSEPVAAGRSPSGRFRGPGSRRAPLGLRPARGPAGPRVPGSAGDDRPRRRLRISRPRDGPARRPPSRPARAAPPRASLRCGYRR
ncbi:MAG: ComEC/Rec2 family competence protein [Nakamurella sp.]